MFKKFLFAITFISITTALSIAGYSHFSKPKSVLAQIVGENIYISQSGNGSQDGSDCNNAHPVLWFNTVGNWANPKQAGKIGPGDTAHLCGKISTSLLPAGSGSLDSVVTLLFESGASLSKTAWGAGSSAAIYVSGKNYITIDGNKTGIIENTDNGTGLGSSSASHGVSLNGSDYITIKNLTIRNIYVRTPNSSDSNDYGHGVYATECAHLTVYNNIINNAYKGILVPISTNKTNVDIYSNTISRVSNGITVAISNNSGILTTLNIYENKVTEMSYWDGCWNSCTTWHHNDGLYVFSGYQGGRIDTVKIYNNEVSGQYGAHTTAGIFIVYDVFPIYIYNNLLVSTDYATSDGYIAIGSLLTGATSDVHIYNNTIKGISNVSGGGNAIYLSSARSFNSIKINNNIIYNSYIGIWNNSTSILTSDYNNFYNIGYIGRVNNIWYSSFSLWNGIGYDIHGKTSDPLLDAQYIPSVLSSPVVDAGVSLSSDFTIDKINTPRPQGSAWDIGAYEYIQTSPPLKGDFNSDSKVNNLDFTSFKNAFKSIFNSIFDLNSDSAIDVKDLGVLMSSWLE